MIAALLEIVEEHAGHAACLLRRRNKKRLEDARARADGKWAPDRRDIFLTYVVDLVARGMSGPTRQILRDGIMSAAQRQAAKDDPLVTLEFTWRRPDGTDVGEHFHGCPTPTTLVFDCGYCQERSASMSQS